MAKTKLVRTNLGKHMAGWFPPEQKPVLPGIYAVTTMSGTYPPVEGSFKYYGEPRYWYAKWDGEKWGRKCDTYEGAWEYTGDFSGYQHKVWAGWTKARYVKWQKKQKKAH